VFLISQAFKINSKDSSCNKDALQNKVIKTVHFKRIWVIHAAILSIFAQRIVGFPTEFPTVATLHFSLPL
jgi:hypothetical protein